MISNEMSFCEGHGSFTDELVHPRVRYAKKADTLIRNYLAKIAGFELNNVRYIEVGDTPTIYASLYGVTTPHPDAIKRVAGSYTKRAGFTQCPLPGEFY